MYYIPRDDVHLERLEPSARTTVCEWKGSATYWSYRDGDRLVDNVAWSYERPQPGYESIAGHLAFYAGRVDEAWVGDERATPQPGGFYGGWVTSGPSGRSRASRAPRAGSRRGAVQRLSRPAAARPGR